MFLKTLKSVVVALALTIILSGLVLISFNYSYFVILVTFILCSQSIFTLFWMLYSWNNPESLDKIASPQKYLPAKHSFTALLPVRHEEKVIVDTIKAVNKINYPESLKQILIICRSDDKGTIKKAQEALKKYKPFNADIIVFNDYPINKPHGLNHAIDYIEGDVVCIFDAEDEPHPDIYKIINTTMINKGADVVQSGVQLMNYRSNWFAPLAVLEYYFWFKSGLAFFSNVGKVTPLGGNTVFFKTSFIKKIGGWDANCLTEDADIGIRLTNAGAKTSIIYDTRHCTQEEVPHDTASFIKQRTRWVQGFIQIILKLDWLKLPTMKQKIFALYILCSAFIQSLMFIIAPFLAFTTLIIDLPLIIALLSFVPLYLTFIQLSIQIAGIFMFARDYSLKFPFWTPFKLLLIFFPYQSLIAIACVRAILREYRKENAWEKTVHLNLHRS